jgi:hypothetical protein
MQHEQLNAMTSHNLAVIFGPTLFGTPVVPPMPHMTNGHGNVNGGQHANGGPMIGDMGAQNKVSTHIMLDLTRFAYFKSQNFQAIETILEHYKDIFVEE